MKGIKKDKKTTKILSTFFTVDAIFSLSASHTVTSAVLTITVMHAPALMVGGIKR